MTRINCVPPQELSRQHLLAEYRELPRVFSLAAKAYHSPRPRMAPAAYTLGAGHVLFFYSRLGYCRRRFGELRDEMLRRGYQPRFESPPVVDVGTEWWQDWSPDEKAIELNRKRIAERTKAQ